jgi:ribosome-interacting GTPase 1
MRRMMTLVNDLIARPPENRDPELLHWEERLQARIARSVEDLEERQEASVEDRQGLSVPRDREISLATSRIPL